MITLEVIKESASIVIIGLMPFDKSESYELCNSSVSMLT